LSAEEARRKDDVRARKRSDQAEEETVLVSADVDSPTMADGPDLSIVIVNWKSVDFVRRCLESIYASTRDIIFEVLVVDNASFDGCGEMLEKTFRGARFIQSRENLGFARASNLATEHSTGRILLFLNPDTEVVGPSLECMVACLESLPDVGVLGPKLLNSDLSIQTSCVQSFPSLLNQVLDTEFLRALFPKSSLWRNRVLVETRPDPVPVEGISGACLMVRRSVFERVGRFNPEYFMYCEDLDLCYRVQNAGLRNYYIGTATVIHHGGQSTNSQSDDQFSSLMMRESVLTFVRATRGYLYASILRSATAFGAFCRLSLLAIAMIFALSSSRRNSVSRAIVKWARVFRWAIGLETWVKRFT
jgi:GT2 family glycosyltransferase